MSDQVAEVPITVALVEDHRMVRDSLARSLGELPDLDVVAAVAVLEDIEALEVLPDVLLLDLDLDGHSADPAAVARLRARGVHVVIVSALAQPGLVREMVRAGVTSLVDKRRPLEELVAAVRDAAAGRDTTSGALAAALAGAPHGERPALSAQEERALVLYASGLKMSAVARRMGVSEHTAKEYVDRVRAKYAATPDAPRTKTELHDAAVRDGYLDPP